MHLICQSTAHAGCVKAHSRSKEAAEGGQAAKDMLLGASRSINVLRKDIDYSWCYCFYCYCASSTGQGSNLMAGLRIVRTSAKKDGGQCGWLRPTTWHKCIAAFLRLDMLLVAAGWRP